MNVRNWLKAEEGVTMKCSFPWVELSSSYRQQTFSFTQVRALEAESKELSPPPSLSEARMGEGYVSASCLLPLELPSTLFL